jgi:hypothetical protein
MTREDRTALVLAAGLLGAFALSKFEDRRFRDIAPREAGEAAVEALRAISESMPPGLFVRPSERDQ